MAEQTRRPRTKAGTARKKKPNAPLTQMLVADALRSWVLPALAAVVGLVVFVGSNIDLIPAPVAVTIIGTMALILLLFYGLRSFTEGTLGGQLVAVLVAFVAIWSAATWYPFYRALNPGTPLFAGELKRNGPALTVPMHNLGGRYSLRVHGHFPPPQNRQEHVATYKIALGHEGGAEQILEGTFRQEWHNERFGVGRRSSTVPVMKESVEVQTVVDDGDGRDLTLKLAELSNDARDEVTVQLYPGGPGEPLRVALGVLSVIGALLVDAWRPRGANEGLMTTLTISALATMALFLLFDTRGLAQLFIAALAGLIVGGIAGSIASRLTPALRKRLPELA